MNLIKNCKNEIYGISQTPDTKEYIMVLQGCYCENLFSKWCKLCNIKDLKQNFTNWTSENKKIDDFIQKMQLKINNHDDIVFEWIPYYQFNEIKEIDKTSFATVYSASWMDGPLYYSYQHNKYTRDSNKKVALKCLHNSQNIDRFLNEVRLL